MAFLFLGGFLPHTAPVFRSDGPVTDTSLDSLQMKMRERVYHHGYDWREARVRGHHATDHP